MGEMGPKIGSFDVEDVLSQLNVDEKITLLSGRSSSCNEVTGKANSEQFKE
jgi:hypothetical protein